jgi:hypothetical protein
MLDAEVNTLNASSAFLPPSTNFPLSRLFLAALAFSSANETNSTTSELSLSLIFLVEAERNNILSNKNSFWVSNCFRLVSTLSVLFPDSLAHTVLELRTSSITTLNIDKTGRYINYSKGQNPDKFLLQIIIGRWADNLFVYNMLDWLVMILELNNACKTF